MRKKLKQPSFAAGVHRDEVYAGAELLGIELDEHIANVDRGSPADRRRARPPHARPTPPPDRGQASSAATSRSRSSSLVHQPHETRTSPRPGISRTCTPASWARATSAAGSSSGRKLTSVEAGRGRDDLDARSEELAAPLGCRRRAVEPPAGPQLDRRAASPAALPATTSPSRSAARPAAARRRRRGRDAPARSSSARRPPAGRARGRRARPSRPVRRATSGRRW